MSYAFSDYRFGIYARCCIYSDNFGIKLHFWWKLHIQSCFWSKSCFCCSWTADSVSRSFDTRFGKFMVERTLGEMEFVFLSDVRHTSVFEIDDMCCVKWRERGFSCNFYMQHIPFILPTSYFHVAKHIFHDFLHNIFFSISTQSLIIVPASGGLSCSVHSRL